MKALPAAVTVNAIVCCLALGAYAGEASALPDAPKLTLRDAVDRALVELPQGVVVEAELESEGGRVSCDVEVVLADQVIGLRIDPDDGALIAREEEGAVDVARLTQGRLGLSEALAAALQAKPGRAVKAEIIEKEGRLVAEIELASKRESQRVLVDLMSGEVLDR